MYISKWVWCMDGDSCCYIGIRIFGVKSTLFKFVFEVEGLKEINYWKKGFPKNWPHSILMVPCVVWFAKNLLKVW